MARRYVDNIPNKQKDKNLRLKKLKAHKSAKGTGARGASFKAKAQAFRTLGALLVENV